MVKITLEGTPEALLFFAAKAVQSPLGEATSENIDVLYKQKMIIVGIANQFSEQIKNAAQTQETPKKKKE